MGPKQLPADQRPREKLLARGPGALADTELLALLLRTGIAGHDVFALSQQVLDRFGGFHGLLHATVDDLKPIKGLGPAKRAEIAAVVEMARRALAQQITAAPVFDAPAKVKDYLALQLGGRAQEVFAVLFLDGQHRLIVLQELFHGTLTQTSVYPREVVKAALAHNAGAVILAHNHPSGVAEPSRADEYLTATLKSALALVDVRVLDHLVVGRGQVVSLAERGAAVKVGSLKELKALRDTLQRRAAEAAARAALELERQRAAEAERRLFANTVGPVTPLPDPGLADIQRPLPAPEPLQRMADEQAALREALSDEVDVESLLLTDDGLSFRRPGVPLDVVTRLRSGQWARQGQIDLHGLTREEARTALAGFIRQAHQRGQRCLRVVHGKGHGSPGRQPVLKAKVQRWLAQCDEVVAFSQARGAEGGAGALIVLLDSFRDGKR